MKKFGLLFLLFTIASLFVHTVEAGTAVKKSAVGGAQGTLHNFSVIQKWDFDTSGTAVKTGAAAGTNTDTVILYADSASSTFFTTNGLRTKAIVAGVPEAIPDSLKYCVLAKDDAADAVTLRTEYQIRQRASASWFTVGGNGDLALAGSGVPVFSCFTRNFTPDVAHRLIAHVTTTTDSASLKWVEMFPVRK